MKKSEIVFNLASIPVDALMLLLAGIASFYSRLHSVDFVGPIQHQLHLPHFILISLKVLIVPLVIFSVYGLYNLRATRAFVEEVGQVMLAVTTALALVIILFFFNRELFPSRFIILAAWAYGGLFVILGRLFLRGLQIGLLKRGYGIHRLVVINGGNSESKFIRQQFKDKSHGYKVVAELHYDEHALEALQKICNAKTADEVMQTNASVPDELNLKFLELCKNAGIAFSFVPNLFDVQRNVVDINTVQGVPVISIKNTPLDGWGKVVKRLMDIVCASISLVILSPAFLLIWFAIKLDSKGKVIYPALRGGKDKDFMFYKFRSMYSHLSIGEGFGGEEAEKLRQELWQRNDRGGASGPFLKVKNDPRVTRVGRFLRKTKLDEIPQFWNVLKGDMSMVGPRAHVLDEVERYRNRYQRMFSIKPGIFGMSQVAQSRWPDLPFEEEIRLNTYYIENWSLWLDIKILVQSFYLLLFAKKPDENY